MRSTLLACLVTLCASSAAAMNIVLTNDDGFESVNTQALFSALRAAGHDVILSAPYNNMSGFSAFMSGPSDHTGNDSPAGTVKAGAPGVGPTTIAADQYYVDGTPAAAISYGLSVLAPAKWGHAPDLVISGPNVGNNLGTIIPHSGTVGAAITALNHGVPAIAVSGANGDPSASALLAQVTLRVLGAAMTKGRMSLPAATGLNINVPTLDLTRTAASYRIAFTQVSNESAVFGAGDTVTVSPIQGTYQAACESAAGVLTQMRGLFSAVNAVSNPELINVSMRGTVGADGNVMIAGFVVSGSVPKKLLVRASGPALAILGVSGFLADPTLEIINTSNQTSQSVASNDNWSDDATTSEAIAAASGKVGAFPWTRGSKDAALLLTLQPGIYTAIVRGANRTAGIGLLEVYDVGDY